MLSTSPARNGYAITKSNTTLLSPQPRGIFVGGAGTVRVQFVLGTDVDFVAVAGTVLPIAPKRVMSTGTTATSMVALHD